MSDSLILYFAVGFAVCFMGTLPFGPINLTVVQTAISKGAGKGFQFALAASVVEILEALVAILFGMIIADFLAQNIVVKGVIAAAFIILGVVVLARSRKPGAVKATGDTRCEFMKGLIIALLNPQAIPFWIFALTAIGQYVDFQYQGTFLGFFLMGIFVGKIFALSLFIVVSQYLKTHLQHSSKIVDRVLGGILLFIGIGQIGSLVMA